MVKYLHLVHRGKLWRAAPPHSTPPRLETLRQKQRSQTLEIKSPEASENEMLTQLVSPMMLDQCDKNILI